MMPNQERVLHGLDSCGFHDGIPNICEVTECPYRDDKCGCVHELAHDAGLLISELLKAQEPKPPVVKENAYGWKFFYCPSCGREFYADRQHGCVNEAKFCDKCGQAVKWG